MGTVHTRHSTRREVRHKTLDRLTCNISICDLYFTQQKMSTFTEMFYDMEGLSTETFSDIETDDSSYSNLIQDTQFHSSSNSYYSYQESDTIFGTVDFPMELTDIKEDFEDLEDLEDVKIHVSEDVFKKRIMETEEKMQTLMVPVINVKTDSERYLTYKSDSEESEVSCESSVSSNTDEEQLEEEEEDPRYWSLRGRRRHVSSESEDADWEPEPEKVVRKGGRRMTEGAKRSQHVPVPQKRTTGTQKITQWIMSLLQNPQHNPSVLTWEDEKTGTFKINNTTQYAKLWGKKKNNHKMNYEKLSRAMRYYYKNGELKAVPE